VLFIDVTSLALDAISPSADEELPGAASSLEYDGSATAPLLSLLDMSPWANTLPLMNARTSKPVTNRIVKVVRFFIFSPPRDVNGCCTNLSGLFCRKKI
jgi:hypothetical protein